MTQQTRKPMTTAKLRAMKQKGEPIAMITAYDYPSAALAEAAGADMILVGDSLGNVVQGRETTLSVTMDHMVYHTELVSRAVHIPFVVADLPFLSYHGSVDETLRNVKRIMQEGGAKAVKMEGGKEILPAVRAAVSAGVPVVAHLGLTPQSVHAIGGYKVQGKANEEALRLLEDAKALEEAGAFCLVLELVTDELSAMVTEQLSIPTIGIGSGARCDGQVLVFHDILQYTDDPIPKKFVKSYANIGEQIKQAIHSYVTDVKSRSFPAPENTFHMDEETAGQLYGASKQAGRGNEK
ncbi:3-methyl-2-oxobutanoate hydroxymethyltransferase [Paenibacillus thermotolerans]|uniref:3-methyl-2-oxobutanoate hydroxymethyltransferase n=1 Tax=Paenibacillus thermotolerans TaxID=3027807 RepID=UPI0023677F6F|nr:MULTISPECIES: 3-methyl-2-oxobutanoate hydroxymethyltransferase [unclassified Paenibacillus]